MALLVLFSVFSFGLDLWTDALWYGSVGFDAVFWTRLSAQAGLFVAAGIVTLVVLLGNLWLAGRLMPPPDLSRPGGSFRSLFERLNEAAAGRSAAVVRGRRYGAEEPRADQPSTPTTSRT